MKTDECMLLLLDGDEPSEQLLRQKAEAARMIIATDGAARTARKYEIPLDVIIGDMDSLDEPTRKYYEELDTSMIENPDQYSNDLEKALRFLIETGMTDSIIILGLHGKRTDHTLTSLSTLVRYRDHFRSVLSIDNYHEHHLLTQKYSSIILASEVGTIVSLTPLPIAGGVITEGLFYPIQNEEMFFGKREGLGNIVQSAPASVAITSGALLVSVMHPIQR